MIEYSGELEQCFQRHVKNLKQQSHFITIFTKSISNDKHCKKAIYKHFFVYAVSLI